jgi:hypothetical protein
VYLSRLPRAVLLLRVRERFAALGAAYASAGSGLQFCCRARGFLLRAVLLVI